MEKLFSNKSFKEIELFLQTMPINTSDKLIQEIIFEILVSKKTFDRNLINDDDDKYFSKFSSTSFLILED